MERVYLNIELNSFSRMGVRAYFFQDGTVKLSGRVRGLSVKLNLESGVANIRHR